MAKCVQARPLKTVSELQEWTSGDSENDQHCRCSVPLLKVPKLLLARLALLGQNQTP